MGERLVCSCCGFKFTRAGGERVCEGCPFAGWCGRVRCPRCGFEVALPRWRQQNQKKGGFWKWLFR